MTKFEVGDLVFYEGGCTPLNGSWGIIVDSRTLTEFTDIEAYKVHFFSLDDLWCPTRWCNGREIKEASSKVTPR